MLENFYRGKRVLITGITGFKGAWLGLWLHLLGAKVFGYALPPPTRPSLWQVLRLKQWINFQQGDLNETAVLRGYFRKVRPQIVFHLAAQSLVGESFRNPRKTLQDNVLGTLQVLQAAQATGSVQVLLNVTSDKCYAPCFNKNQQPMARAYREADPLGGSDMYAASKACAEIITAAFRRTYLAIAKGKGPRLQIATARAGNVIGGGDWAKERLIPDLVRALGQDRPLILRRPQAIRPWQHVLDALSGYLVLAAYLGRGKWRAAEQDAAAWAFNFGPRGSDLTVAEVVNLFLQNYPKLPPHFAVQVAAQSFPENPVLRLAASKARRILGWHPVWNVRTALQQTARWYERWQHGVRGRELSAFSIQQILDYMEQAAWPHFGG